MLIKAAVDADAFASKGRPQGLRPQAMRWAVACHEPMSKGNREKRGSSSSARAVKLGLASQQVRQMLGLAAHG